MEQVGGDDDDNLLNEKPFWIDDENIHLLFDHDDKQIQQVGVEVYFYDIFVIDDDDERDHEHETRDEIDDDDLSDELLIHDMRETIITRQMFHIVDEIELQIHSHDDEVVECDEIDEIHHDRGDEHDERERRRQ